MNPALLEKLGGNAEHYPHVLEARFKRVFERMAELWGTPAFDDYVNGLFINDTGSRQGFPEDAMKEIFRLSRLHDEVLARAPQASVPWEMEAAKRGLAEANIEFSLAGLEKAIERGRQDIVDLFLKAGFNLEQTNEQGWTPLMVAAFFGKESAAEMLIGAGARIDARDAQGYRPIHWAALQGFDRVVAILLEKKADPNALSNHGITPLIQAAARGHLACVCLLLDGGGAPNLADEEGWTPLHKAVANRHYAVARELVEHGADKVAAHRSGKTPLDIAHDKVDVQMLAILGLACTPRPGEEMPPPANELPT